MTFVDNWALNNYCLESNNQTLPVLLTYHLNNNGWVVDDGLHCRFRVVTGARDEAMVA